MRTYLDRGLFLRERRSCSEVVSVDLSKWPMFIDLAGLRNLHPLSLVAAPQSGEVGLSPT
jgi:hypothetical protein